MNNSPEDQNPVVEKLKAVRESNDSDKNYNALKALISSIPAVGSLSVGLWESRTLPPAMERLYIFLEDLAREVDKLKSKIELVDFKSPAFQSTLIYVSQIVSRTHEEQKLQALRNIVLNSSIPSTLEDDVVEIFLNWINGFTPCHISTLKCLHYLDNYSPEELRAYFHMLDKKRTLYNQVLKDLADRGLISLKEGYFTGEEEDNMSLQDKPKPKQKGEKHMKMKFARYQEDIDILLENSYSFSQASKTTELGKEFIKFIEYPSI